MRELPPISILDLDEHEDELPDGVVLAHEEGHLEAAKRFFPGVRVEIRGARTVYVDGDPFDITDRDAVLRQCAVLLAGARAEAIWRRQRDLPMPIASDSGYDRRSIREMCERGGYDVAEIEAEAWQMLAFD